MCYVLFCLSLNLLGWFLGGLPVLLFVASLLGHCASLLVFVVPFLLLLALGLFCRFMQRTLLQGINPIFIQAHIRLIMIIQLFWITSGTPVPETLCSFWQRCFVLLCLWNSFEFSLYLNLFWVYKEKLHLCVCVIFIYFSHLLFQECMDILGILYFFLDDLWQPSSWPALFKWLNR